MNTNEVSKPIPPQNLEVPADWTLVKSQLGEDACRGLVGKRISPYVRYSERAYWTEVAIYDTPEGRAIFSRRCSRWGAQCKKGEWKREL